MTLRLLETSSIVSFDYRTFCAALLPISLGPFDVSCLWSRELKKVLYLSSSRKYWLVYKLRNCIIKPQQENAFGQWQLNKQPDDDTQHHNYNDQNKC